MIMKFNNIFKTLLERYDVIYCWLDPNGKVIEFSGSHQEYANRITKQQYGIEILFRAGWQRVNSYGTSLFSNNSKVRPNRVQLKELKNLAIERGMEDIIWDNDIDAKTIWRK